MEKVIKTVYKNNWFSIEAVPYQYEDNPYFRLTCSDSASILAKTVAGKIILTKQYRPSIDNQSYELPAGYIGHGEKPLTAAKRELLEETGFKCKGIYRIGKLKIVPSRVNNTLFCYFGEGALKVQEKSVEDRGIKLVLMGQKEFEDMIKSGSYVEAAGIAMYYLSKSKGYL
jgi:ADP-ribose pyrophosphatase